MGFFFQLPDIKILMNVLKYYKILVEYTQGKNLNFYVETMKFVGKKILDSQSMFSFVQKFHHLPTKKEKCLNYLKDCFGKNHKKSPYFKVFFLKLPYLDIGS
jgi:hypothetical protein